MTKDSDLSNTSNIKIERLVLGCILLSEDNYWIVGDILSMDHFATDDHQKIYAVMSELASANRAIRPAIVAGRIGGLSDDKDPDAYLSMLQHVAAQEPEGVPLEDYAYELRSAAMRRQIVALAENMLKTAKDLRYDPQSLVDRASERMADISRSGTVEFESTISSTLREVVEKASASQHGMAVKPCLRGLESLIGHFMPGTLVLWGGGPGSGKTAMVMQQLIFSSPILPVSIFELEMDNRSAIVRSVSNQTGVSMRDVMAGMTEEQYEAIIRAEKHYQKHKLLMYAPSTMTIQQIRSKAFALKRKFGLSILAVDHVKLIGRTTKGRMDPVERAYENTRDLKSLAKDLDCTVIALCQFTKAARQKENPEPEMEDFYGGSLEEHADVMLANFNRHDWLTGRPPQTNNNAAKEAWEHKVRNAKGTIEVHKLKDRFGEGRGKRTFMWHGKTTTFGDQNADAQGNMFGGDLEYIPEVA